MQQDGTPIEEQVRRQLQDAQQALASRQRPRAVDILRQLLGLKAAGTFWGQTAVLFYQAGDLDGARLAAQKFVTTCPDNDEAKSLLASILGEVDRLEEALPLAEEVARKLSDRPMAHYGLGTLRARTGETEAARAAFRRCLEREPSHAMALEFMAYIGTAETAEADLADVERALSVAGGAAGETAAMLQYARGTLLERLQRFDDAYDAFARGAAGMQQAAGAGAARIEAMGQYIERLKASFSAAYLDAEQPRAHANERPVFIVGVPRSGTTLVEAVLGAHPQVTAGGENGLVNFATMEFGSFEPPDLQRLANRQAQGRNGWAEIGERLAYLHEERFGPASRVTDKNLGNHFYLGAISLFAAGAKIIWCRRDKVATAWSCFKTRFTSGNAWSYDFAQIARYQQYYDDLMQHWQAVLPQGTILEVHYEELVGDAEPRIRELLEHAGLPFDPACLEPHRQKAAVKTASLTQVRQPMHAGANEAWRRYEQQLAPHLPLLRGAAQ